MVAVGEVDAVEVTPEVDAGVRSVCSMRPLCFEVTSLLRQGRMHAERGALASVGIVSAT